MVPNANSELEENDNKPASIYKHGKYKILVDKSFYFLGTDEPDTYLPIN